MGQTQGKTAGGLDLHEGQLAGQNRAAEHRRAEGEVPAAEQDVLVKGDAQIAPVQGIVGLPLVAEKHRRPQGAVILAEILDLGGDLSLCRQGQILGKAGSHQSLGQSQAPLVDHIPVFFLQFHKHRLAGLGLLIAAQPQLFFIGRFFHRPAHQPEILGVAVDAADGGAAVPVQLHKGLYAPQHRLFLGRGEQIFQFVSLECHLCRHKWPPLHAFGKIPAAHDTPDTLKQIKKLCENFAKAIHKNALLPANKQTKGRKSVFFVIWAILR